MNKYPIYIVSKGRWKSKSRLTIKALDEMSVPYRVVVEPQEYQQYASVVDPSKILTLPFSNLGQGSIPARNWIWDHAASEGAERFWQLDDNIRKFATLNHNIKRKTTDASIFEKMEYFTDRFTNVALSGCNYWMFAPRRQKMPPYYRNTRIYSCILIRTNLPYRFRGIYNEDTDLSLRALKDGWCTILFNAFLAEKMTTQSMEGGNTAALYLKDGREKMAESLREQHPDVTKVTWKWNRWQHHVDYRGFKANKLILKGEVAA